MSQNSTLKLFFTLLLVPSYTGASTTSFFEFDCKSGNKASTFLLDSYGPKLLKRFKKGSIRQCGTHTKAAPSQSCPQEANSISGMDSRYPVGGIFISYTGSNQKFIKDLAKATQRQNPDGIMNLIVPQDKIEELLVDKQLQNLVKSVALNFIPVAAKSSYTKWTRDLFEWVFWNNTPALLHLNYGDESDLPLKKTISCELSRQCSVPLLVPSQLSSEKDNLEGIGIDSGGNIDTLPVNIFYMGVIATPGFDNKRDQKIQKMHLMPPKNNYPVESPSQKRLREALLASGKKVINLDISFLYIGHVDEIINVVKTNERAPCDFSLLVASPRKAVELIENEKKRNLKFQVPRDYAKAKIETSQKDIQKIIDKNLSNALTIIKDTTACKNPKAIEVPTLFLNGKSILPNQINSLQNTTSDGSSALIAPQSGVLLFDEYLKKELSRFAVKLDFIDDSQYFHNGGDIHCATNEMRVCSVQGK